MVDKERIFAYFKVSNSAEKFLKNQTNVDLIILNNFHFPAPTTQPGHVQQPQAAPEVRKSVKKQPTRQQQPKTKRQVQK